MSQSARLSIALQAIAQSLNDLLADAAGEEIAWVMVCQTDGVAQYISNCDRPAGRETARKSGGALEWRAC